MAERPGDAGGGMPEFEMPPEPLGPPPAPVRADGHDRPSAEVSDAPWRPREIDPPIRGRRRYSLRALAGVGILGVVLVAVLPGGIQLAERAAATADRTSLEQAALAYVTALAEGRAADAAALVEPPSATATLLVDAVLASADRLTEPTVAMVAIDGEEGRVDVGYRVARSDFQRTLDAEREGGGWRITTPLVETVSFWDSSGLASLGGVAIPGGSFLLYPGVYSVEGSEGVVASVRSSDVRVDGDPATTTELYLETTILPAVEAEARERAEAIVAACLVSGGCTGVPRVEGAEVRTEHAYLQSAMGSGPGSIHDIGVGIAVTDPDDEATTSWVDVIVRVTVGEDGASRQWSCLPPGLQTGPWSDEDYVPCDP